jgi:hypothetical protein
MTSYNNANVTIYTLQIYVWVKFHGLNKLHGTRHICLYNSTVLANLPSLKCVKYERNK